MNAQFNTQLNTFSLSPVDIRKPRKIFNRYNQPEITTIISPTAQKPMKSKLGKPLEKNKKQVGNNFEIGLYVKNDLALSRNTKDLKNINDKRIKLNSREAQLEKIELISAFQSKQARYSILAPNEQKGKQNIKKNVDIISNERKNQNQSIGFFDSIKEENTSFNQNMSSLQKYQSANNIHQKGQSELVSILCSPHVLNNQIENSYLSRNYQINDQRQSKQKIQFPNQALQQSMNQDVIQEFKSHERLQFQKQKEEESSKKSILDQKPTKQNIFSSQRQQKQSPQKILTTQKEEKSSESDQNAFISSEEENCEQEQANKSSLQNNKLNQSCNFSIMQRKKAQVKNIKNKSKINMNQKIQNQRKFQDNPSALQFNKGKPIYASNKELKPADQKDLSIENPKQNLDFDEERNSIQFQINPRKTSEPIKSKVKVKNYSQKSKARLKDLQDTKEKEGSQIEIMLNQSFPVNNVRTSFSQFNETPSKEDTLVNLKIVKNIKDENQLSVSKNESPIFATEPIKKRQFKKSNMTVQIKRMPFNNQILTPLLQKNDNSELDEQGDQQDQGKSISENGNTNQANKNENTQEADSDKKQNGINLKIKVSKQLPPSETQENIDLFSPTFQIKNQEQKPAKKISFLEKNFQFLQKIQQLNQINKELSEQSDGWIKTKARQS